MTKVLFLSEPSVFFIFSQCLAIHSSHCCDTFLTSAFNYVKAFPSLPSFLKVFVIEALQIVSNVSCY